LGTVIGRVMGAQWRDGRRTNRLAPIRRTMHGRGSFELFRRRLLGAAWDAPTTPGIEGRRREESVTDRATAIFAASGQELSLSLHNRPYATAQDDWDRDVVTATIAARAGAFRGGVATILWAHELAHLRQLLVDLRQHVGQAEQGAFATIEPALSLTFHLSRLGRLRVDVQLRTDVGLESEALLAFSLAADQSYRRAVHPLRQRSYRYGVAHGAVCWPRLLAWPADGARLAHRRS
jgi:hypothetical protein